MSYSKPPSTSSTQSHALLLTKQVLPAGPSDDDDIDCTPGTTVAAAVVGFVLGFAGLIFTTVAMMDYFLPHAH